MTSRASTSPATGATSASRARATGCSSTAGARQRAAARLPAREDRRRTAGGVRRARAVPRRGARRRRRARRARRVRHAHARARARGGASAAERAYARGEARPLEGLTLAVKDLFDTAGVRTTYGSSDLRRPRADGRRATRSRRARDAGAIVVGKTLTHEFAWGITQRQPALPAVPQPVGPRARRRAAPAAARRSRWPPGRRRSRSAPTPAARSASRPSFCGVSGLKPTYGRHQRRRRLPARPLARPRRPDGAHARRRARCSTRRWPATRAGRPPATRIAVCPDLHLRPLEPGIQRAFEHAVAASTARSSRSASTDAERHLPGLRGDPERRGRARARRRCSRRAADEYGEDVARAHRARADGHARRVRRGDRDARAHPRGASRALFAAADLLLTPIAAVPPEPRERSRPAELPRRRAALHRPAGPRRAAERAPCRSASTSSACRSACSSPARRGASGRVLAAADALFSARRGR